MNPLFHRLLHKKDAQSGPPLPGGTGCFGTLLLVAIALLALMNF